MSDDRPRRPGRPPKESHERLDVPLTTRVTTEMADQLYQLATEKRTDLPSLIRETLQRLLRDEASRSPFQPDEPPRPGRATWGR